MPTPSTHIVWLVRVRVETWRCSLGRHYSEGLRTRAGRGAQRDKD